MSKAHPTFKELSASKLRALADKLDAPKRRKPLTQTQAITLRNIAELGRVDSVQDLSAFGGVRSPCYRLSGPTGAITVLASAFTALNAAEHITAGGMITARGEKDLTAYETTKGFEDSIYVQNPVSA